MLRSPKVPFFGRLRTSLSRSSVVSSRHTLARRSALYRFVHRNLVSLKLLQYALVVLLNLNTVMANYGDGSQRGYSSAYRAISHGKVQ